MAYDRQWHQDWYRNRGGRAKNLVSSRRTRYAKLGWTVEDYETAFQEQKGLCAVCGEPESAADYRSGLPRLLAADHNHKTGKRRQLLCYRCNSALGFLQEDPKRITALLHYLERHSGRK